MQTSSIKVAIRIRPMNNREINVVEPGKSHSSESADRKVVAARDNDVVVYDSRIDDIRQFSFDYVYDQKSRQEEIFEQIGMSIVNNAIQGYNCCIFAYGSTGSGKTYTMLGDEGNAGLIPRMCNKVIEMCSKGPGSTIEASFAEIYREKVYDLLDNHREKRIREHSTFGVYIEDISKPLVRDLKDIKRLLNLGSQSRITAETNLNARSSRSHAIFTLYLSLRAMSASRESGGGRISSKIHMIDLAGSEKINLSGVTGNNLREAIDINKSLTTLGTVVRQLVQNNMIKKKKTMHISFRDSVLTWLLKESLSGNSISYIMANVSPAFSSIDDTISTLRYAFSAKKIVNRVSVNVAKNTESILRKEIDRLNRQIEELKKSPPMLQSQADRELKRLNDELEQNNRLLTIERESVKDKLLKSEETHKRIQEELKSKYNEELRRHEHSLRLKEEEVNKARKKYLSELEIKQREFDLELETQEKQFKEMLEEKLRHAQKMETTKIADTALQLHDKYEEKLQNMRARIEEETEQYFVEKINSLYSENNFLKIQVSEAAKRLAELEMRYEEAQQKYEKAQQKYEEAQRRSKVEVERNQEELGKKNELETILAGLKSEIESKKQRYMEEHKQLEELKLLIDVEKHNLKIFRTEAEEEQKKLESELEVARKEKQEFEAVLFGLKARIGELEERNKKMQNKFMREKNRLSRIKSLTDKLAGS